MKSPRLWLALALAAALAMAGMLFAAAKPVAVQAQVAPATYVCEFTGAAGPLSPPVGLEPIALGAYSFDTEQSTTGQLVCAYQGAGGVHTNVPGDGRIESNGNFRNDICGTGAAWSDHENPAHSTTGHAGDAPAIVEASYHIDFVATQGVLRISHWRNEIGETGSGEGYVKIAASPLDDQSNNCVDGVDEFEVSGAFTLVEGED